jgi:hypothetical protein
VSGLRLVHFYAPDVGYVVDVGSPAFVRALEDAVVAVMIEKASAVEHVEAMPRSRAWTWCSSVPPTTPRCASAWPARRDRHAGPGPAV